MTSFFIYFRLWRGFPDSFEFDRFNSLSDEELESELKSYAVQLAQDPDVQARAKEWQRKFVEELKKRQPELATARVSLPRMMSPIKKLTFFRLDQVDNSTPWREILNHIPQFGHDEIPQWAPGERIWFYETASREFAEQLVNELDQRRNLDYEKHMTEVELNPRYGLVSTEGLSDRQRASIRRRIKAIRDGKTPPVQNAEMAKMLGQKGNEVAQELDEVWRVQVSNEGDQTPTAPDTDTGNGDSATQAQPEKDDDAPPEQQVTRQEYERLLKIKNKIAPGDTYIGQSIAILRVFERIEQLNKGSRAEKPILICGPSGSGKSKIAKLIHSSSSGKTGEFRRVSATGTLDDLTAMKGQWFGVGKNHGLTNMDPKGKKGYIQKCEGGTLFVDEVADLPIGLQEPLRDVIDREPVPLPIGEGDPVDPKVRLVFATRCSEKLIDEQAFLPDLYDRMRRQRIDIPPLNKRREDIFGFVNARRGNRKVAFRFWWALLSRDWARGNVRALIDVLDAVFDEISDPKQAVTEELLLRIQLDPSEPAFEVVETDEDKARDKVIDFLTGVFEAQGFTKNKGLQKRIAESVGYGESTVSKWLR